MTNSIRWRLALSFIFVTLLTALVVGGLAYGLLWRYIRAQERAALQANAEAVAAQALPLVRQGAHHSELQALATMSSYLGGVRVRVLDSQQRILADSGFPQAARQFLWLRPSRLRPEEFLSGNPFPAFILPILESERSRLAEELNELYDLSPTEEIQIITSEFFPWGSRIEFETELAAGEREADPWPALVIQEPLIADGSRLGVVELQSDPGLGAATLESTARALALATAGAVLVSGLVGLWIARRLTLPLKQLAAAAAVMSGGDLSSRAPVSGQDEIGQLGQQFNRMADSLQASFSALAAERDTLRRFVADASHELRTPITALRNNIELLGWKRNLEEQTRSEFLQESQHQIERLEWITANLLDLSRLDAGLTALKREPASVTEMMLAAAAPFLKQAQEKGLDFMLRPPKPDISLQADRALLELALVNLLDNAIKYTAPGGQVMLSGEQDGAGCRIMVFDSGAGIDPQDIEHIFERFYRGRNAREPGSGLGLAIVKSVVSAHGGEVQVASELGVSSRFTLRLPNAPPPTE